MSADRDPAIAAVLDRLPVPPPREGFWDDVRGRLEGETAGLVELGRSAPHPPRRTRPWLAVAAAAAVVAAVAGAAIGLASRDDKVEVGPRGTGSTTVTTPPEPAALTGDAAVAVDAVQRWIAAVVAGDADAAWALVGPQSAESIGGRPAFDDLMVSAEFPESWRTWDDEVDQVEVVPVRDSDVWVVVLGAADPAGNPDLRIMALAARVDDAQAIVEPFVPGPALDVISLPQGSELGPNDLLTVYVDPDADGVAIAVDGSPVAASALEQDVEGAVIAVHPNPSWAPGSHYLVVAYLTPSGTILLDARTFRISDA